MLSVAIILFRKNSIPCTIKYINIMIMGFGPHCAFGFCTNPFDVFDYRINISYLKKNNYAKTLEKKTQLFNLDVIENKKS